jgi:hypothetical protein
MLDGLAEAIGVALEMAATDGSRWMRVGCTAMLILVVLALLTLAFWLPR